MILHFLKGSCHYLYIKDFNAWMRLAGAYVQIARFLVTNSNSSPVEHVPIICSRIAGHELKCA